MCLPSVFEVLKWSEPRHTLQHSCLVSSAWAQTSRSDLLWLSYSKTAHFPALESSDGESELASFRRQILTAKRTLVVFSQTELQLFDCEAERVISTTIVGNARVSHCSAAVVPPPPPLD